MKRAFFETTLFDALWFSISIAHNKETRNERIDSFHLAHLDLINSVFGRDNHEGVRCPRRKEGNNVEPSPVFSPTSTRPSLDIEVDEEDQDLISPANGSPANGPAIPPIIPDTTQATTTSTFAPWRTSRRTTGKNLRPSSFEGTLDSVHRSLKPTIIVINIEQYDIIVL